ncbi:MAG: FAD-dependent oxidoreductase [Erysipelotrichaceae bacterium]|nr:FAD-dependent oxidoreductase [Erysipelotrichaceae bacterium]
MKYPNIFAPLRVKNIMLKNRIIAAPMGTPKATVLSSTNYGGLSIWDKSKGGAAVVTVSDMYLANLAQEKDAFSKYAKDVTREVLSICRQAGSLAMLEIAFMGNKNTDGTIQGPSNGKHFTGGIMKEMSLEEMKEMKNNLVRRAQQAKEFGFDMLMLHFGHDSLCSLFLSPIWNQRDDMYGGSLDNRIRYAKEVLEAIRTAVGEDYPILVRFSRSLKVQETFKEEDMLYLIKQVQHLIDIVNVSCGMDCYGGTIDKYVANTYSHSTIFLPRMYNLAFAEKVKKECNVLVCVVGGVLDPKEAEAAIKAGKTDLVMMGRQLIADPYWPKKLQNGLEEDIVPCLRCLYCYHISTEHDNTQCSVNPRYRRENRVPLKLEKVESNKHVVVIGGGPAGMKAALTLNDKGHKVTLIEKEPQLGGNLKYADYGMFKEELKKYREYLIHQVQNANIQLILNKEATKEYVESLHPDGLIIAVGADIKKPQIMGIEYAIHALDIYPKLNQVKGSVVVIGGGTIGSELAYELSLLNHEVSIIEKQDALVKNANWLYRHGFYNAVKDSGHLLKVYVESQVKEITPTGVSFIDKDGKECFIKADTIVLATGMTERRELAFSFYGITPETAMVGDCYKVAQVLQATNDAYFIAENM